MIIVLKQNTKQEEIDNVIRLVEEKGLKPVPFQGVERTVVHVQGDVRAESNNFASLDCVEKVVKILKPFKLASREHHAETTVIKIENSLGIDVSIGNGEFVMIAGPCSAESEDQLMKAAKLLKEMGVKIMRASVFKPRTSPYDFQGMGIEGLKLLKKVRDKVGILVETEVMDVRDVRIAAEHVDILRVGARNMQNFDLLKEMGKINKPVILKRGSAATIKEFLMAAEYILANGNKNVILCERGIRTFETAYRNTLDINAVALLKRETHLPVIVDPSHSAGIREIIAPISKAAAAVGADGLLVEMHPNPEEALCDGAQSLHPHQLAKLLGELKPVCEAVGRKIMLN
ncbi:MAG: 3-deoxy-7-phosphoheptulonate synthase [Candidatus Woesearchaeota archaeon]